MPDSDSDSNVYMPDSNVSQFMWKKLLNYLEIHNVIHKCVGLTGLNYERIAKLFSIRQIGRYEEK